MAETPTLEGVSRVKRPNILFIMSDDHAAKAISAYGSGLNSTPNIDRIGEDGAVLHHCYVTNSICTPSRASILTGTYNHVNGVRTLASKLDNTLPNVAKHLRSYGGYQTAMIGKWHLGEGPEHEPSGFDYWEVVPDQGQYFDPAFITPKGIHIEKGYATDIITNKTIDWIAKRDRSRPFFAMCHHKAPHRSWECHPKHRDMYRHEDIVVPSTYDDDYKHRARAAAAAKMRVEDDLTYFDLGLVQPEGGAEMVGPLVTPSSYMNPIRTVPMPADDESVRRLKLQDSETAEVFTFENRRQLSVWKYQRYIKRYLRTIASIDENVGRVLDFLEQEEGDPDFEMSVDGDQGTCATRTATPKPCTLASQTLVIYTSDQGFFLGDHGWFDKRFIYEESFQMPFLIKAPGVIPRQKTIQDIVSNVDFAPLFLEWAGLAQPSYMQGRSFLPLLLPCDADVADQRAIQNRDSVAYHRYWMHNDEMHHAYNEVPQLTHEKAHYGIRDQRYKLIFWYNESLPGAPGSGPGGQQQEWEFFDCHGDPMELFNLWAQPDLAPELVTARERMVRLLEAKMEAIGDEPRHPIGLSAAQLVDLYPVASAQLSVRSQQHNMH